MERKILVFDIDGTLTNSKKEISPLTKQAIEKAQDEGHLVMLASGRPTKGLDALARQLRFDEYGGYLLSFNGGRIQNYQTKEIIFQQVMDHQYIEALYDYCKENNLGIITYTDDEIILGTRSDEYIEYEGRINGLPIKKVDNFVEYVKDIDLNKCLITADPAICIQHELTLAKMFEGKLGIYRSTAFFIEVVPLGIDKAQSIDRLIKRYDITSEDIISFGDGCNDISMIEYAGVGVAMGNAEDVVKEAANIVTETNDNDGIAKALSKLLK